MQSLCKAVKAVINSKSPSSGPLASLPHNSWDTGEQAQAERACWGWDTAKQCPWLPTATRKSDTKGKEETKRTLLFLSNTLRHPTKLNSRASWAWCGFSVNFSPTKLNQRALELTVKSNIHSILQQGAPSSAACYVKDRILYFALNLSFNYLLPSDVPEFSLLSANNWALPTVSILPTTLEFFQIFPKLDLWTEE